MRAEADGGLEGWVAVLLTRCGRAAPVEAPMPTTERARNRSVASQTDPLSKLRHRFLNLEYLSIRLPHRATGAGTHRAETA